MQVGTAKRRALRYFIYIKLLGDEPLPFEHPDYGDYELALQAQFALLCLNAGAQAANSARKRGDKLIRGKGVLATVAEISSLPMPTGSRIGSDRSGVSGILRSPTAGERSNCRRKIRHARLWNALSHALQLRDPNVCVYTCFVCDGLHVGHVQTGGTKAERAARSRLYLINQALRELERVRIELRREKRTLSKKYGCLELIPQMTKVIIHLFCRGLPSRRSDGAPNGQAVRRMSDALSRGEAVDGG
jgi:hypothetical protein